MALQRRRARRRACGGYPLRTVGRECFRGAPLTVCAHCAQRLVHGQAVAGVLGGSEKASCTKGLWRALGLARANSTPGAPYRQDEARNYSAVRLT